MCERYSFITSFASSTFCFRVLFWVNRRLLNDDEHSWEEVSGIVFVCLFVWFFSSSDLSYTYLHCLNRLCVCILFFFLLLFISHANLVFELCFFSLARVINRIFFIFFLHSFFLLLPNSVFLFIFPRSFLSLVFMMPFSEEKTKTTIICNYNHNDIFAEETGKCG